MKDEGRRRIIIAAGSDAEAAPDVALAQARISHAIARDFADAVGAYSRLSETLAPQVEIEELGAPWETEQRTEPSSVVLVCPLSTDGSHVCASREAIENALGCPSCPGSPLIYAIAYAVAPDEVGRHALDMLHDDVEQLDASWGGALLLGSADTLEHLYRLPRMGAYRRPVSHAIDLLVCAARMREPLAQAMHSIGYEDPSNLICARPGLLPALRIHQAIWHR